MITDKNYFKGKELAVVGAGTAGVISVLHSLRLPGEINIKWYYDPNKKPVSVGEGSQVAFPEHLAVTFGFDLGDIKNKLDGSVKLGIEKINWGDGNDFKHNFIMPYHAIHFNANKTQDYVLSNLTNEKLEIIDKAVTADDINADWIIDCTGAPSNFDECNILDNIPVNKAYIVQAEHNQEKQTIDSTLCIARPFGWVFIVPLANRYSIGYIFNSDITPDEDIKKDVEEVYKYIPVKPNVETGFIPFKNYIRKENFTHNKAYNGNASFFMEPIEATSQGNIFWINQSFNEIMGQPADFERWNQLYTTEMLWSEMIINLHYLAGSKWNNDFWNEAYKKALVSVDKIKDDRYYEAWKKIVDHKEMDTLECVLDMATKAGGIGQWNTMSWHQNLKGLNVRSKLQKIINNEN